jgi:hypothetical protein
MIRYLGAQALCEPFGGVEVHRRCGNDDELVATQPGDQTSPVHRFGSPRGEVADELVAGEVAEIIVDRLEPVEIEEQDGYRAGPPADEAMVQMRQQGSAVRQCRQIIVLSLVAQLILDTQASLHLREHGCDDGEGAELVLGPFAVAVFDEAERSGGDITGQEWDGRQGHARYAARLRNGLLVVLIFGFGTQHDWHLGVFAQGEDRVRVGEVDRMQRVRVGFVRPPWPFGYQDRGVNAVVVIPQEADVYAEDLHEFGQYFCADVRSGTGGRTHELGSHSGDDGG